MTFFILGSHPELSIAELKAVLGSEYRPIFLSEFVVVIQPIDRNLGELQERLAGIVKVGQVVGEIATWNKTKVTDLVANLASGAAGKNKISFGLSVYDLGDEKTTRQLERDLDRLGLEVKKRLKETHLRSAGFLLRSSSYGGQVGGQAGRPVRYVKGKEPRLSSVIIETNGLLESGGEYVLLVCKNKILIGQTKSVQNFKAWSDRDYGRPARDAKSGMLPPKLARMMINLGGIEPRSATLLDPFCGSGTVLMEAALMGFNKLIGGDVSKKAIKDTTTNMAWLAKRFDIAMSTLSLHVTPAVDLPTISQTPVNLLVTEVFLGNPRMKTLDQLEARRIEAELIPLFRESFKSLATLLKPNSRAVVAFPAYKQTRRRPADYGGQEDGTWYRLPLKSMLEKLGYHVLSNFLYQRENQFVGRDIYVLSR